MPLVPIDVVGGVEGIALYVCDKRMVGPKPRGGGQLVSRFEVNLDDLQEAIAEWEQAHPRTSKAKTK